MRQMEEFTNRCDLLKNSYLCLLNNTALAYIGQTSLVVIC